MKRKIVLIFLGVIVVVLFSGAFYLSYDAGKATRSIPIDLEQVQLANDLSLLSADFKPENTQELSYQDGDDKALLVVSVSQATGNLKETFQDYIDMGKYQYWTFESDPMLNILITDWQYMPLYKAVLSATGLERKDYGNWYAFWYGTDASEGKPNYRYLIQFTIEKGNARYSAVCFCNGTDFLNDIIKVLAKRYTK